MLLRRLDDAQLSVVERGALQRLTDGGGPSPRGCRAVAVAFFLAAAALAVLTLARDDVRSIWFALCFVGGSAWWQRYRIERDRRALMQIIRRLDDVPLVA